MSIEKRRRWTSQRSAYAVLATGVQRNPARVTFWQQFIVEAAGGLAAIGGRARGIGSGVSLGRSFQALATPTLELSPNPPAR